MIYQFRDGAQLGQRITIIDISEDTGRQVVVSQGTPDSYQGHPTTLLMPDQKTMFCVYPLGHGGPGVVLRRSEDTGLHWSRPLEVPVNWSTANNCPALFRFVGPDQVARIFVFEGNGAMRQSVSLDDGNTWSPLQQNGLSTVMPFTAMIPIDGGRLLGAWSRHCTLCSVSDDGGLTWSAEQLIADENPSQYPDAVPCEPALIRSPDGATIACLMRENSRKYNALVTFSHDEGATWSEPVETSWPLTGDRHQPRYSDDGRLVICFRDMAADSATRGHFVAWVGTFQDIVDGADGQYRVKLLHSHAEGVSDCGYPGLELLPDGTFVATTYIKYRPGPEKHSVVSSRFKLSEIDALKLS
jgi:hypothetical protein